MPLHLLGKKSWNVYNPANIARVKADEAVAAAKEAADEQQMQELDAERRAAILRGQTPPPLPEEKSKDDVKDRRRDRDQDGKRDGHDRKRRRLAGEDDTDRDIRIAKKATEPGEDEHLAVLKLRQPKSDAPLTDHAGNINLFPIDLKEVGKREKNAEVEKEKKRKERVLEDQYTMRFSNASGKDGFKRPWYTSGMSKGNGTVLDGPGQKDLEYSGFTDKDVWGREDPHRREREQARISTNDPLGFMNKAQAQLKKSKGDRKKWVQERDRELRELRAAQEREHRRDRHGKRKKRADEEDLREDRQHRRREKDSDHRSHRRSRSGSHERRQERQQHVRGQGRDRDDQARHGSLYRKERSSHDGTRVK